MRTNAPDDDEVATTPTTPGDIDSNCEPNTNPPDNDEVAKTTTTPWNIKPKLCT